MSFIKSAVSVSIIIGSLAGLCLAEYAKPLSDEYLYVQALWNMDSHRNGVVSDEDALNRWRKHHLQLHGTARLARSKPGYGSALDLDGREGYAKSVYPWWQNRAGVIIEMWVWIAPDNEGTSMLASCPGVWSLFLSENEEKAPKLTFQIFNTGQTEAETFVAVKTNSWQHIRAEYNEGDLILRAGEDKARSQSKYNKLREGKNDIYLGRNFSGSNPCYFKGRIDDVRISSPKIDSRAERGRGVVECAFIEKIDADKPIGIVNWCMSALWLGSDNYNVSEADIELANKKLVELSDPQLYDQLSREVSADERDLEDQMELYWSLPNLARIACDPKINARMTEEAKKSVTGILADYVAERDVLDDARVLLEEARVYDESIWSIYISSNHEWLKNATFLLTAQHLKNKGMDVYADGYTAKEHYEGWVIFMKEKFKQWAARGIDPEISSPGYFSLTFAPLFNIRDFSEDNELASLAEKYITLYLADAAVESFYGVRGGSRLRSYKHTTSSQSYNPDRDSYGLWSYVLSNVPSTLNFKGVPRTLIAGAMSDYTPPKVLYNLMRAEDKTFEHISTRPARDSIKLKRKKGVHSFYFPTDLRRCTYGNPEFIMGSFAIDDTKPTGYYNMTQNMWFGLITSAWRYSRIYIQTDNPEVNRNRGYRDLTAIQSRGAMLFKRQQAVYREPALACWLSEDFLKNIVMPDASTDYWIFTKNITSDVYVAIKAADAISESCYEIDVVNQPDAIGSHLRIISPENSIVAMEAVQASDYADFTSFCNAVKDGRLKKNGEIEVEYSALNGSNLKMYSDGSAPKLDDKIYELNLDKTYVGEYLYNNSYGDPVIYIRDTEGNELKLDFNY